MTLKTLQVLVFLSLALLRFGERRSEWKSLSKNDGGIEFQWSRPANNSCEVSFRDLRLRKKTSLIAVIQYLPHRSAKETVETDTAKIVIGGSGLAREHISDCEEIVTVNATGVGRE
jgi:hypothetical protein